MTHESSYPATIFYIYIFSIVASMLVPGESVYCICIRTAITVKEDGQAMAQALWSILQTQLSASEKPRAIILVLP